MLVLVTFLSMCAVVVAFMLRFLFALEADVRSHEGRAGKMERIRSPRISLRTGVMSPAGTLRLIYSNPQSQSAVAGAKNDTVSVASVSAAKRA